jgi:hypothetical protein
VFLYEFHAVTQLVVVVLEVPRLVPHVVLLIDIVDRLVFIKIDVLHPVLIVSDHAVLYDVVVLLLVDLEVFHAVFL